MLKVTLNDNFLGKYFKEKMIKLKVKSFIKNT